MKDIFGFAYEINLGYCKWMEKFLFVSIYYRPVDIPLREEYILQDYFYQDYHYFQEKNVESVRGAKEEVLYFKVSLEIHLIFILAIMEIPFIFILATMQKVVFNRVNATSSSEKLGNY